MWEYLQTWEACVEKAHLELLPLQHWFNVHVLVGFSAQCERVQEQTGYLAHKLHKSIKSPI